MCTFHSNGGLMQSSVCHYRLKSRNDRALSYLFPEMRRTFHPFSLLWQCVRSVYARRIKHAELASAMDINGLKVHSPEIPWVRRRGQWCARHDPPLTRAIPKMFFNLFCLLSVPKLTVGDVFVFWKAFVPGFKKAKVLQFDCSSSNGTWSTESLVVILKFSSRPFPLHHNNGLIASGPSSWALLVCVPRCLLHISAKTPLLFLTNSLECVFLPVLNI